MLTPLQLEAQKEGVMSLELNTGAPIGSQTCEEAVTWGLGSQKQCYYNKAQDHGEGAVATCSMSEWAGIFWFIF